MQISNSKRIIAQFKDLLKGTTGKSKLLSDKFCSVLEQIPELISFINEDNYHNTKLILEELSQTMEIKEYKSGNYIRKLLGKNDDFYMILSGCILELEIKYICTTMTFKEFVLFLTKLYLLKENYLYYDCLEKNNEIFPFYIFKNYINKLKNDKGNENEKNSLNDNYNINNKNNINIISICNEINTKDFNYKEELKLLKKNIKNSAWYKRKKILQSSKIDYNIIINNFLELYNSNKERFNNNLFSNEIKYTVYLPYFINKRILEPISFIGNLDRPYIIKNYKGYICLSDCFIIYLNKNLLKPNQYIYKLSSKKTNHSLIDNIFQNHYLFKNVDKNYLNKNFAKYFKVVTLKKNEILFKQNEPHKGIYIITKGLFQLKTYKSYNELNDLNFILMHSLDNYPQYITNLKKKQINNKGNLNGYYDYNSNINIIMKNPLFSQKAKEKNEIFFCVYGVNEILGLGEIYNSKNNINIFTAKCFSDEAELLFLPIEIFNSLITNDNIYNKCGIIIEEKVNILTRCISKYRNIFENNIEYLIKNEINFNNKNNKQDKKYARISFSGKQKPIKGFNTIISKLDNYSNRLYKSSHDFHTFNDNNNVKLIISKEKNKTNLINTKQNIYEEQIENINYLNKNCIQKELHDNNNFIDNNKEKINISKKKLLVSPNIINNSYNFNSLFTNTPKVDKKKLLNENNQYHNNSPSLLGNKNLRNQVLKSSSSFFNDNSGIKKRMEEMSRFYSGYKKRNSGPIIISYLDNNFLNNNDDKVNNNVLYDDKKKLKLKINKDSALKNRGMRGRCLSAQRYDENDIKNMKNSFKKTLVYTKGDINNFNNYIQELSDKKKNLLFSKQNYKKKNINNNKPRKITINKFSSTSLFPTINSPLSK